MKQALLVAGLISILSACQKEYSCYCKYDNESEFLVKTIKAKSKKKADEACKAKITPADLCYAK